MTYSTHIPHDSPYGARYGSPYGFRCRHTPGSCPGDSRSAREEESERYVCVRYNTDRQMQRERELTRVADSHPRKRRQHKTAGPYLLCAKRVECHWLQPQHILDQVSLFNSGAACQVVLSQEKLEVVNDAERFQLWSRKNPSGGRRKQKTCLLLLRLFMVFDILVPSIDIYVIFIF